MQGCSSHFLVPCDDLKKVCNSTIQILRDVGVRAHRRGVTDQQFKVEGIMGNSFAAIIARQIPFLSWFGWFSRLKVTMKCMRSLTEGDDSVHLFIRVFPIMEMHDGQEQGLLVSQDLGEYIGDNAKAKQIYRKLVKEMDAAGLIDRT